MNPWLALYLAGAAAIAARTVWVFEQDEREDPGTPVTRAEVVGKWACALLFGVLWPLVLAVRLLDSGR